MRVMNTIDVLAIFKKALSSLEELYDDYLFKKDGMNNKDFCIYRDALIQRFEYTFELTWKLLKHFFKFVDLEVDSIELESKKGLFRVAAKIGLISDVERWFVHLLDRNLTSHTYDEDYANEIFINIPNFIHDSNELLHSVSREYEKRTKSSG